MLPFAIHMAPRNDVWFDSTVTFVAAFVAAGLVGGVSFGFVAVPASIVAYFISIAWLEHIHLLGSGGDGDLFYLLAMLATAASCVAATVGSALRSAGVAKSLIAKLRDVRNELG